MNNEIILQITAGRGPAECCWVVAQTLKAMCNEAAKRNIALEVLQRNVGPEPGTLVSALLRLHGGDASAFAGAWVGTVLWVGQSPYRKFHKRKNWYVGVNRIDQPETGMLAEGEIIFQTLRASGPGGQHVNKTESAVRAIHVSSGIQVTASDQRSQLQNKKLALERLQERISRLQTDALLQQEQSGWQQHNTLSRGNPVRTFKGSSFAATALSIIGFLVLTL